ncbi:hypothetical protein B9Q01_09360 [Candidatus Marsarchaeota G1 archaeon OSP_D]|uniref:YokE-like PH domain-containing protein n=5 Tax=Candidatus Marsarchaeota TaxID=1978152 RepID=A0A2R6A6J8_9ARCH|nr:MAG: hypothetical protein B9Q01_09360 [Candidatus Marsarchaeota G1 archaeon OSP_D]PSN86300.1 MAG: hypothetical protein B9Q00_10450 [Candidatus Marsarchaeota G1 archaeon OSP_C]
MATSFIFDTRYKLMEEKELSQHIKKIQKFLLPGERVLVVATQSRWKRGGKFINPGTIYATDRRLIIRDPYTLGLRADITIIPYDKITGVRVKKGLLSTSLEITAAGLEGGKSAVIKWGEGGVGEIDAIDSEKAERIASLIGGQAGRVNAQVQNVSVAEELEKLAQLREKGVITEEEFQELKAKLIKSQQNF